MVAPTKINRKEDLSSPQQQDDESLEHTAKDIDTETQTNPLFVISRVFEEPSGDTDVDRSPVLNNSHTDENPIVSEDQKYSFTGLEGTGTTDTEGHAKSSMEQLEMTTHFQDNKNEVDPDDNTTVVATATDLPNNTSASDTQMTKESENQEKSKVIEPTLRSESSKKKTSLQLKSDGTPAPSPKRNMHQQQQQQQPNPSPSSHTDEILEEKAQLDPLYVGRVIGKGGEMIRDLQARSACRIDVDQNFPAGQPRIITYRGTRKTIDFAKNLVQILCSDMAKMGEMDLPLGEAKQKVVAVPASSIGRLIGRYA